MRPPLLSCVCAIVSGLFALGCSADAAKVEARDVLRLSHCPEDSTCDLWADGRSIVTVQACLAPEVTEPAPDLTANFTLSAGQWVNAPDPTDPTKMQIKLSDKGCELPSFITGTIAEVVRIDAEFLGFAAQDYVELQPALLDSMEIVPMPPRLDPGPSNEVQLAVSVRAKGIGKPSNGTRVSFSVADQMPQNAAVLFYPQKTIVDPETGEAGTTVEILGSVESVKVRVTATPPERDDGMPVTSISEDLPLQVIPPI
jgi:hypothetical protein